MLFSISTDGGETSEDYRPACIFVGYSDEMSDISTASKGFKRHVTVKRQFRDDYTPKELADCFCKGRKPIKHSTSSRRGSGRGVGKQIHRAVISNYNAAVVDLPLIKCRR